MESCLRTSAKTGFGLEDVLPAVIERIPPPRCFKWPSIQNACEGCMHLLYVLVHPSVCMRFLLVGPLKIYWSQYLQVR